MASVVLNALPAFRVSVRAPLLLSAPLFRQFSKKMAGLPRVYFDISADGAPLGRIIMEVGAMQPAKQLKCRSQICRSFAALSASQDPVTQINSQHYTDY
jgi:hypothetical protein